MLSVSLVSFGINLNLGPAVIGTAEIRPSGQGQPSGEIENLTVPWQDLQPKASVFALMSWHGRLSDFRGRNPEIDGLKEWAASAPAVSVKFVTGCGGAGKSRFAAEFASLLQTQGWAAGFVDLRKPAAFALKEAGTLLVVDYPEESPHETGELLRDLAGLGQGARFRVLFLTRRTISHWESTIHDSRAAVLVDPVAIDLPPISPPNAYDLFCSAQDRTAELWTSVPLPLSKEAFTHWLGLKEEHKQPLFVLAAAIQGALHPEEEAVRYTGQEIVKSLAERELTRLRVTAERAGFQDQCALARLLVAAAIIGQISQPGLNALVQEGILGPDVPQGPALNAKLQRAGVMSESVVDSPKPDIVAAAFSVAVLTNDPRNAPDFLWRVLQNDIPGGLQRLARLTYDAEVVLAIREHKLSKWLAEAVNNYPDRCVALRNSLEQTPLPVGLTEAAVAVWRTLLTVAPTNEERARLLNNLSAHLSESGDRPGALQASQEAVEIRRRLAEANPARYEPDLASSLNNLSTNLAESGDGPGALEAIQEAVEIRRRLAKANPARYEPALAMGLNNLSTHLAKSGDGPGALEAIQEAVEIRRRLAKANPARYEPALAMSLNNLSGYLARSGDGPGALEAIQQAMEIRRRLAKANPARYDPALATNLNNLSTNLAKSGDGPGALEAIQQAMEIRRRLAKTNPARYEPDLAMSLNNLSGYLAKSGDGPGALEAIQEAVEINQRLAKTNPARYEPDLAMSLNNLSTHLAKSGDGPGALEAIQEAVEINQRLAKTNPARYEPDLAVTLNNLSNRLDGSGDGPGALEAIQEAVEINQRLAKTNPARYEPDLAVTLNNLSNRLARSGDGPGALKASQQAVEIYQRLAKTNPTAMSLNNLSFVQREG